MKDTFKVLLTILSLYSVTAHNNPYRHILNLGDGNRYILEWQAEWNNRSVIFNVTAATTGYIGLGLSARGSKSFADIIIGGVGANGVPYLHDMHGSIFARNEVLRDESQDLILLNAWENGTHTSIRFTRPFETCDRGNDYVINDDTVALLWSFGEDDDYQHYHYKNRGVRRVHLLDPDWAPRHFQQAIAEGRALSPEELGDVKVWTVSRRQVVPAVSTVYWCSFHNGPQLQKKHHVIGFNFRRETEIQVNRTHHLLFYKCHAPEGEDPDTLFQPFVQNSTGEMCYFATQGDDGGLPMRYCHDLIYAYAIGEQMTFLPEHAGIPIGESPNEYYALQVHYDNWDQSPDLDYTINIDLYYTEKLRDNEVGIAFLGHQVPGNPPSILIPPSSPAHIVHGHCSSACTRKIIPDEGLRIVAIQQHTHLSGRRHRLRHFRGDQELPWLMNDDNYDGNYQSIRMLRREMTILPGDALVTQCSFDNTWLGGSVVGGFSTRQEMCLNYVWYYSKMREYSYCRSEIWDSNGITEKHLGARNFTWSDDRLEYVVNDPERLSGMTISEVANQIDWTIERREALQREHLSSVHWGSCPSMAQIGADMGEEFGQLTTFPKVTLEYEPPRSTRCARRPLNRLTIQRM